MSNMDIRLKAYYFHEAMAIRRQNSVLTARSVRAAASDENGFRSFVQSLETEYSREETADMTWDFITAVGKG